MKKILFFLCLIIFCLFSVSLAEQTDQYIENPVLLLPPEYDIPATVCLPTGEGPFPAVVMLHCTGSNQNEVGDAYVHAAHTLAEKYGIASIRFDFPGNGENTAEHERLIQNHYRA